MRRVIPVLVAAGLAIGVVWLWWLSPVDESPPLTEAVATTTTTSTTTTTLVTTTTTLPQTTTTSGNDDSHVVETIEEAEEILRELWFGWFEGIYNQDEDRIREVVVLEETVETAKESFGVEFDRAPQPDDIAFSETEILRADAECLAVWTVLETSGFRAGSSGGVEIIRWTASGWKSLSTWANQGDLWETDCDSLLP